MSDLLERFRLALIERVRTGTDRLAWVTAHGDGEYPDLEAFTRANNERDASWDAWTADVLAEGSDPNAPSPSDPDGRVRRAYAEFMPRLASAKSWRAEHGHLSDEDVPRHPASDDIRRSAAEWSVALDEWKARILAEAGVVDGPMYYDPRPL